MTSKMYLQAAAKLPKSFLFGASSSMKEFSSRRKISISTDPVGLNSTKETEKFVAALPEIVSNLTQCERLRTLPVAKDWVEKLITYNSTGGNKIRGLMTVYVYQTLESPENITEETLKEARILGWCVELLQAYMLILDDILDNSSTRGEQTSWYKLPDVGMRALNDSSCLVSMLFECLKTYFGEKPYYPSLVDIFNEGILQIAIGQRLDITKVRNYELFTVKNYNNIAIYKTAYYTYKLPIYAGSLLANKPIDHMFQDTDELLNKLGVLTLMQNDYMDCFGDESVTGKMGTAIQQGKCTWLAVQALQRCNAEQRALFEQNYARADKHCVQRIKRLYEQLYLPALYRDHERTAHDHIVRTVEAMPQDNFIPPSLIHKLFLAIYYLCYPKKEQLVN